MIEIECTLDDFRDALEALNEKLSAWYSARNSAQKGISWHFSSEDARIKLAHLYPTIKI